MQLHQCRRGRATSRVIGTYHPETFKVANARAEVAALKAKGGAAIGETLHRRKVKAVKRALPLTSSLRSVSRL